MGWSYKTLGSGRRLMTQIMSRRQKLFRDKDATGRAKMRIHRRDSCRRRRSSSLPLVIHPYPSSCWKLMLGIDFPVAGSQEFNFIQVESRTISSFSLFQKATGKQVPHGRQFPLLCKIHYYIFPAHILKKGISG